MMEASFGPVLIFFVILAFDLLLWSDYCFMVF